MTGKPRMRLEDHNIHPVSPQKARKRKPHGSCAHNNYLAALPASSFFT